ncbi:GIY-YIG catalytic domain-containing protein [Prevotellaceae bacterium HUN156]|nr:GIY-YIG catalytic domain-containing protein [Prevotellaceae bacterium HUN156]
MAKVFQILVPDNTLVSRIISCENQVTELFVIDRADKNFVSENSKELNKPALYILCNRDKKQLYVGETDDSLKRLKNHEAKDFWTEAIVFHSTTDTLSTTEVKWLEAKTYETLAELGYYDLSQNKQKPQSPPLKKNQIYTLEPIFEEAKNYICAAGFDIFLKGEKDKQQEEESLISCTLSRNADAKGLFNPQDGSLIVLKGSKINPEMVKKASPQIVAKRIKDIAKYAKKSGKELIVTQDVRFNSPSGAAVFCCGGSANGWIEWKDANNNKLEIYKKKE